MDLGKEQKSSLRGGIGMGPMAVLRAIQGEEHNPKKLATAAVAHVARAMIPVLMANLVRDGYIVRGRGGLCFLTDKGRAQLPSAVPAYDTRPYIAPPMPPRRPGSCHAHIPSVMGSQLVGAAR